MIHEYLSSLRVMWLVNQQHTGSRREKLVWERVQMFARTASMHLGGKVHCKKLILSSYNKMLYETIITISLPLSLGLSLSDQGSGDHLDLMELIGVPLPPSVSFSPGYDDFPAYNFGLDANIGRHTKTFVPGSFYRDFAIIVTVTLDSWF